MSAPAGQAARRLAPAGAAALAGLAAGDRTEALRDRPTESEEVPLAGSWLEIGLKPGDVDVDGGLEILAPAAVETIPTEAVASEAARRAIRLGADLARDPAVQRAVAARIGGVPQLEDVSREGETEALRAVVEALASERDDLLRERLETQREALGLDVEGLSLPPTPPEGSEGSADSIEEMFWGPQRRREFFGFLEGFGVGLDAVRLHSRERVGPLRQAVRHGRLCDTAAANHKLLLDERAHDAPARIVLTRRW